MVVTNSSRHQEAWDGILPHDIMATDILPRLPVKSLARFRCVCKQWRSLTYDPCFAMEQSIRGADADTASTRLCMLMGKPGFASVTLKTRMYNLDGLNGNDNGIDGDRKIIEEVSLSFKFRCSGWYTLSNSVNGLFCALCRDHGVCYPYLFNPTTREVLPLPEFSSESIIGAISLGFDSSLGQHMVLFSYDRFEYVTAFRVLTVGTRDWRWLAEQHCLLLEDGAVFLDGAFHWEAIVRETDAYSPAILAFDIKDERFRFIPTPESSSRCLLASCKVKGHICSVMASRRGNGADGRPFLRMWKLEDGANPEWRRMYDINMAGCVDDDLEQYKTRAIDVVCGKILIHRGFRLYSYDEGSKTLDLITECLPLWWHIVAFTPTVVSPGSLPSLPRGGMPQFTS